MGMKWGLECGHTITLKPGEQFPVWQTKADKQRRFCMRCHLDGKAARKAESNVESAE